MNFEFDLTKNMTNGGTKLKKMASTYCSMAMVRSSCVVSRAEAGSGALAIVVHLSM